VNDRLLHDTRDRVIRLDERFSHLEARVLKNSHILDKLDRIHSDATAVSKAGKALWGAGRYAFSAISGAGGFVALQHWLKLGLISLALLTTHSALSAEGWLLEIEACGEWIGCRRTAINLGGAWRCEQVKAELMALVPTSNPEAWGFAAGTKVRVQASCSQGQPRA
jgi:hypothetical protein